MSNANFFFKVIPMKRIINDTDGDYWRILLPKGIELNDYDKELVELENTHDGWRRWFNSIDIFNVKIGQRIAQIFSIANKPYYKPCVITHFDAEIKRKRCYVKVYFDVLEKEDLVFFHDLFELPEDWFLNPVFPNDDDLPF